MSEEKKKDNTNEKKGVSFEALSSLNAPVSFWKGIPFGLQLFKMAKLTLWPFGAEVR